MPDSIRVTDLCVRFGRVRALDGLTLSVPAGEVYGFLGRNGAGKTTTLRALLGIIRPSSGAIELLGRRLRRVPVALKRRIGYVSQEQTFYPWMTGRQLGRFVAPFYPSWSDAEFTRLLTRLDVPADRRSVELSGGNRTKLALALALAPRPPLLLLDEPTTGLDPVARREFNDTVAALAAEHGTTVFFSSHLVAEVESIATRVGIVQAGRLCAEGRVADLRERVRVVDAAGVTTGETSSVTAGDASSVTASVTAGAGVDLPPGFTRVRGTVWQAEPERWAELEQSGGPVGQRLPLEEIFLAFARADAPSEAAAA